MKKPMKYLDLFPRFSYSSNYMDFSDDDESINYIDTKTPYISRIIEMKSSKRVSKISDNK
jgi:hypothetical protein